MTGCLANPRRPPTIKVYGQIQAVELLYIPLEWSPHTHHLFEQEVQHAVRAIATLAMSRQNQPVFESSPWFVLPPELLFIIFNLVSLLWPR